MLIIFPWKKKNDAVSSGMLFIHALELSDKFEQAIQLKYPSHPYVNGKSEYWYRFVSVAAMLTAILDLDSKNFNSYYKALLLRIDNWWIDGRGVSDKFVKQFKPNVWVKDSTSNLNEIVSLWLMANITRTKDIKDIDQEVFIDAGNFIFDFFHQWFIKNDMPI
ncbi:hypothetical protein SAMN04488542_10579 [Fontibacillus panacisegetis]|uniref:Uncharacterized protein n=1 Tax=Fontibacillus panacisegetis TaxID=670482 RepID=A0A1G7HXT1_9BACL|nr:hypothetical protein SAMN04488542_10579 [Fontibacillus panacisegetis]